MNRVLGVSKSGALHDVGVIRQSHGHSWMSPDKKKALLYVSDYDESVLNVYSYPKLKMVGQITGLSNPDGVCSDKKGNIWVDNNTGANLVEYKHGGTSPIATVSDSNNYPVGCSVDPTTGNLAASNIFTFSGGQGSVAVYKGASGSPTLYTDPDFIYVYFCGYDNKGNLFIDGVNSGFGFEFAELAKGSSSLKTISLSGGTVTFPGNIRWDGKNVAVGDQEYGGQDTSAIEAKLKQMEDAWEKAFMDKDQAAVGNVVADDYAGVNSKGEHQNKTRATNGNRHKIPPHPLNTGMQEKVQKIRECRCEKSS